MEPNCGSCLIFQEKYSCLSQKLAAAIHSPRYQRTFVKKTCHLFGLINRKASLIGGKCQKLDFRVFVLIINSDCFRNNRLNFSSPSHNQKNYNCRASFINFILGNAFYIGNIRERNDLQVQKFSIFPENESFCSPKLLAAFRPSGYQATFFYSTKFIRLPNNASMYLMRKSDGPN